MVNGGDFQLTTLGLRWAASVTSVVHGCTSPLVLLDAPEIVKALVRLAIGVLVNFGRVTPLIVTHALHALVLLGIPLLSLEMRLSIGVADVQLL